MSEPSKPGFDVFLSYNSQDKPAVRRLKERLVERGLTVWFDEDELRPGIPWQRLLEDGIRASRSVLVLVGGDGLGPWETEEMEAALQLAVRNKLVVIPVLLPGAPDEVELPMFLGNRTWVDLRPRITAQKLDRLVWGITNQKPVGSSRTEAAPRVTGPIRTRARPDSAEPIEPKWSDELRIYGEGFVGRQEELAALDQAWAEGVRIFALHAEGGAGKTRVVVEWLRRMRDDGWRGARRVFVHSFYSQGSDERRNASSELFFEQALAYFGYRGEPITQADERGRILARFLVEHHGLLVLDGLEPLQHPPLHAERGKLKDPGIARLLLSLANAPHDETRGLCLITSRQPVVELEPREGATVVQQSLEHLHRDDGAALLREFEVVGPAEDLKEASDEFRGHAYSLMLLGSFLNYATDHQDIRRRREVVLLEEDTEHWSHARKMFAAYVRHLGEDSPEVAVLRLLGFFDRAAERQLLDVLRAREGMVYEWSDEANPTARRSQPKRIEDSLAEVTGPLLNLSQPQWNRVLNRLRDLRLIDFAEPGKSPAVYAHPLLREYFAEQLRTCFPEAWRAGHRRLFEHLCETTEHRPTTLAGLQPLYQAVAHGCLAGLYQQALSEVYVDRILCGTQAGGFHSTKTLGAVGSDLAAVSWFFKHLWTTPEPSLSTEDQRWLLNEAASRLGMLGRLGEVEEPQRASLRIAVEQDDWANASICESNLSTFNLLSGEIAQAISAGNRAQTYADRSRNAFLEALSRTCLGEALHQAGRRKEALRAFEEAEVKYRAPLWSLLEFRYCDLLLSEPERAAWKFLLAVAADQIKPLQKITSEAYVLESLLASCASVALRVKETLRWITLDRSESLVGAPFGYLTLGRATVYHDVLIHASKQTSPIGSFSNRDPVVEQITAALAGFYRSGQKPQLLRGLLSRAWLRYLTGDQAGCQEDLDEVWEIAERGPMPLYQADFQLYRARLFRDRAALAEARRLIEKHGYHRRDGELADAEEAAKGW